MSALADVSGRDMLELLRLDGRVAVVVGGAGHIGSAVADALAELGASVAIVDRDRAGTARVAAEVSERRGVSTSGHVVDLQDLDAEALRADLREQQDSIDVLVHAAALVGTSGLPGWTTPFAEQSPATWRQALEVNLTSFFLLSQALLPDLQASGHGSIVAVGSIYGAVGVDLRIYGDTGMGSPAAYAASKGGLLQTCRWLATVLAPEVRVNMVSPGGVARGQSDSFVEEYVRRVPLRRMAVEQDVKSAIAFLAGDAASYVTGQELLVDGGWTAW